MIINIAYDLKRLQKYLLLGKNMNKFTLIKKAFKFLKIKTKAKNSD